MVVIPSERAEQVLDLADEIATAENAIRKAITEGMSLRDARVKYRYHSLQTRQS